MRGHITVAIFVVFALWKSDVYCACVAPRGMNVSYGGQVCVDINEYAEKAYTQPTQPGTIVYLMGGTHLLYSRLVIQNTWNISLVGVGGYAAGVLYPPAGGPPMQYSEPLSRIQCASTVSGLSASNVSDLTVAGIAFSGCGSTTNTSAIYVSATNNLTMRGIVIQNAQGYGMQQVNSDSTNISDSLFMSITGTALDSSNSTFTYVVNTVFFNASYGVTLTRYDAMELAMCRFNTVSWAMQVTLSAFLHIRQSSFVNFVLAGKFLSSYIIIEDSTFVGVGSFANAGGKSSVIVSESHLVISGNVSFLNGCSARYGGALYLSDSLITLKAPVELSFVNNTAMFGGGAVYADNHCGFFELDDPDGSFQNPSILLRFQGNTAREAGYDVYANLNCAYTFDSNLIPKYDVRNLTNADILRALTSPSNINIAADPLTVCITYDGMPQLRCSNNQTWPEQVTLYPGQTKMLSIITMDEYGGATPSVVFFVDNHGEYYDTWRTGTKYSYPLGNLQLNNISLRIIPQAFFRVGMVADTNTLHISLVVNPCPVGFSLNESQSSCVCNSFLHSLPNVTCNIHETAVHKSRYSWIGYSKRGALSYYAKCPLDYCHDSHLVNLSDPDEQCNNDHSGTLCGGCKRGLSHVFGYALCRKCSNIYILLLIPFAIMGVALVTLIFVLNLTVSSGTINGFIFYANIVKINDALFQPLTDSNKFVQILSTFVSWLNLDFGIVTCFYKGMEIYGKMALQFAFPAYILLIVGLTILAGRYSRRVSILLSGQNVVPVLATLVLMCYAKVFKTAIAILSYASITVGGDNTTQLGVEVVWRHNGNIRYGEMGHWPLILVAVAMIVLFIIPYTLLLLLTPVLQTKSELKALSWVNKLKPFIDSYEGPYKSRHRFWTGILLMARAVIYTVTTSVQLTSKSSDLMVVICISVALMVYLAGFGVYKKWQYTLLEMFLFADLALLCLIALSFVSYDDSGSRALSLNSLHWAYAVLVGIAFICFLVVLGIQTYSLFAKRLRSEQSAEHHPSDPKEHIMLSEISKHAPHSTEARTEEGGDKYDAMYLRESLLEITWKDPNTTI